MSVSKSRICILSALNIKHMSMISAYTKILDKKGIEYDIIYMDKYGIEEEFRCNKKYVFKNIINKNTLKPLKVLQYFRFRNYAINIIEKNSYDFLIIWNEITEFIFADYLVKKWKGKYCLNTRDYLYQNRWPISQRFVNSSKHAVFIATIASDRFIKLLPNGNYVKFHSLNDTLLSACKPRSSLKKVGEPINIGFIGNIRFFDINKKIIDVFGNDSRFVLGYYGTRADDLKEYSRDKNIKNVDFHDAFPIEDTEKYLSRIDIMNNIYGFNDPKLDYATAIKLYYSIFMKIPVLVNAGTYSWEVASKLGSGFGVTQISEGLNDIVFNWYRSLDFTNIDFACSLEIQDIENENNLLEYELSKIIEGLG